MHLSDTHPGRAHYQLLEHSKQPAMVIIRTGNGTSKGKPLSNTENELQFANI